MAVPVMDEAAQSYARCASSRGRRRLLPGLLLKSRDALLEKVGGPARARVILVLAGVLSVDSADKGTVGALAPQLEAAFHIGNVDMGLLVAVSSLVGAVASLPMGVLTDRVSRTRLLYLSIITWAIAEVVSGFSTSYLMLLLTRFALGGVTATAGPAVGSLIGDLFPAGERGRIYGYILTGELLGSGAGLLISGDIGSATSWRIGFMILAVPTLALTWLVHRYLPEPARGGQSRLRPGDEDIVPASQIGRSTNGPGEAGDAGDRNETGGKRSQLLLNQVRARQVEPDPDIVIRGDPSRMGLWEAVKWVLRVRTNILLIVSSCLGYFFFAGLKTFAILFARGRFGISESVASSLAIVVGGAAIAGIITGGYIADRRLGRGHLTSRLTVAAIGYLGGALILIPAFLTKTLAFALPLVIIGAAGIAAPNSPGDAARLDVVPSRLWGRTEAIRTFLRTVLEAFAPLLFGFVSQVLGASRTAGFGSGVNQKASHVSAAAAQGLDYTFLIMLVPLALAGVFMLFARRSYPTDVASAAASDRRSPEQTAAAA